MMLHETHAFHSVLGSVARKAVHGCPPWGNRSSRSHVFRPCTAQESVSCVTVQASTERSMGKLAGLMAAQGLLAGDCYCLYGDVGAGKSVFSRAFVRAAAQDERLPVPSPTYLLQNIYDSAGVDSPQVHHFDLYRLTGGTGRDLQRLSLQDSFSEAVCLIEWAERLAEADALPQQPHLSIHISILDDEDVIPAAAGGLSCGPDSTSTAAGAAVAATAAAAATASAASASFTSADTPTADASSSSAAPKLEDLSEGRSGGSSTSDAESDEEEDEDEDEEEGSGEYSDRRQRQVVLRALSGGGGTGGGGTAEWSRRLAVLVKQLITDQHQQGSARHGLHVVAASIDGVHVLPPAIHRRP